MSLLIAGPAGADADGLLAGGGALAAIAAAPFMAVQLWTRLGPQPTLREVLRRRGVDPVGIGEEGTPVRIGPDGTGPAAEPALPEVEPTIADGLGAVLMLGLGPEEADRAVHVMEALQPPARLRVVDRELPADATGWVLLARLADARRLSGEEDPLSAARRLQATGAKSVLLSAGVLGGLIVHGELATTYPCLPQQAGAPTASGVVLAAFAGALAGWCAAAGVDFNGLKRGAGVASAVAGILVQGGVKRLMGADRAQCLERFNRLRRAAKA